MKVRLANVTVHHSFHAALALHEMQVLDGFIGSVYHLDGHLRTRLLEWMLRRSPQELDRFRRRRIRGLPDNLVTSIAWPELLEWGWRRGPALRQILDPETVAYLRNDAFDRAVSFRHLGRPDVFHGFEQCSEFSMRRARRQGAVTVLDMPIIHRREWDRLEAAERARVGLGPSQPAPLHDWHVRRKYREIALADYLLVGLRFVKDTFIAEGFPEDRIFTIPYGVDPSSFRAPGDRSGNEGFTILYVGQMSWVKGLHRFMDVYDRLEIPGVNLVVAGLVYDEWRPYFLRRFADSPNPVEVLGTVPHAQMEALFHRADVLVFPSLVGGIGVAVYEAMATGLPVITTDGDLVIRDGVDGCSVRSDDERGWRDALVGLAANPSRRASLGAAAAERVRRFTWERYRKGLQEVYREIARRETRSQPRVADGDA